MSVVEKVSWNQVKDQVAALNPGLFQVINDHPNRDDDDHFLVKASYNYAELIVDNGKLILPDKSDYAALNCDYSAIPYCMILKKNCELFIDTDKRPVPFDLMVPGQTFGAYEVLDYIVGYKRCPHWNISSGSRTVILLPKIQDLSCYKRLATVYPDIMSYIPTHYTEQWNLFTYIANCVNAEEYWQSEVLIFPQHWFDHNKKNHLDSLCQYVLKNAWSSVNVATDELNSKVEWEAILDVLLSRRITPNAYMSDITKHLIRIAKYRMPGFRPIIDEESIPLSALEYIFANVYQLKQYLPTFMHIAPLETGKHKPLYYSVNYPTFLLGASEVPSAKSLLSFLKQLNHVFQTLLTRAKDYKSYQVQRFELFHYLKNQGTSHNFTISDSLPDTDPDFNIVKHKYPNLDFCYVGNFWRGNIKIHPLNQQGQIA